MPDLLTQCVAECPQSSYGRCFFFYRTACRFGKDKCQNDHLDIEQGNDHDQIAAHVLTGKGDRLIITCLDKIAQ